ncbi:DsbE family thiol:disulfide interchange protein [Arenimonas terrae]|uniref:DsbE family thiol:disulfide interchange protein n=1 Tax=Arenimonas terrae TaxID=2546226 RepID=A0A5C4RTS0_9GAMM|nr:DsbE family thiol:disulfide interchange protein [Arenimonas terrae]TNJ34428.1 DsbE family thiol:disulfide interchange protein [Arenimonas terrae]
MIKRLLPLIAFSLLALLLGVGVLMNSGKDTSAIPSPLIGKPAPAFSLPVLGEPSRMITNADLGGAPYLLNVWGSWCPACRDEHPVITELAQSGRIKVIGYDYKDEPEDALRWLEQFGNPYALVIADRDGRAAFDWGIYGAPESFLVDAQGIVRWKYIGPMTDEVVRDQLLPELEKLK